MIMNDECVNSLGEESIFSSSNDEPSSQSEVDTSSNTDSDFHGRHIHIEKRSVRDCPKAFVKACQDKRGIPNYGRSIKTRGSILNQERRTNRTKEEVQNCRTIDAAQTSQSKLNKTMDVTTGSKEQHNDVIDESSNSRKQQYVSTDDGNVDESNVYINISETSAGNEDIGSNSRSGNEASNNNWSKDGLVIKIFPFNETQV